MNDSKTPADSGNSVPLPPAGWTLEEPVRILAPWVITCPWAEDNSFLVLHWGHGTYKVSCKLCGPVLRDVPIEVVEQYAREFPTNPCHDLIEWGFEVTS